MKNRFNWGHQGFGQLADDEPGPIDSMPGSSTSNEADDTGQGDNSGGPALNTNINPSAPVDAGAQTRTSPTGITTGNSTNEETGDNSGGGGGGSSSAPAGTDWTPWLIGGGVLAAAGGGLLWYAHHKKRR